MDWNTLLEYIQANPWRVGLTVYFLLGFFIVRHIFSKDGDRLGAEPFDRAMHVLVFGSIAAWIWPLLFLNWVLHFRTPTAHEAPDGALDRK
ncbi:MAG: hypothetical protein AAGA58_04235 [Verrucomicrobiota bacterium]